MTSVPPISEGLIKPGSPTHAGMGLKNGLFVPFCMLPAFISPVS